VQDRRRKDILTIVVSVVVFCVTASAFGASKYQNNKGGSWLHAFFASMPIILAMAAVVGIAMIVGSRNRGDGMPEASWAAPVQSPGGEDQTYRLGRGQRVFMVAFFGCMLVAAPFFVINAVRTGPGAAIFVGCWLLIMGLMVRSWRRSSPTTIVVDKDRLTVSMTGGGEESVPLDAVTEIRWPYMGGYVTVVHSGGNLSIPKQFERLDDLVIEMRRRNPAIQFDGTWPPAHVR
jgi:hypothetical protein